MTNPWLEWFRLGQTMAQIGWSAPQVIAARTARLSRGRWSAREQAEALRMVTEKVQATQSAQWALWQEAASAQRAWQSAWLAALTGRPRPLRARSAAIVSQRALAPMHRRVRANARRLKRR